jgi:hypothetical protein
VKTLVDAGGVSVELDDMRSWMCSRETAALPLDELPGQMPASAVGGAESGGQRRGLVERQSRSLTASATAMAAAQKRNPRVALLLGRVNAAASGRAALSMLVRSSGARHPLTLCRC